MKSPLFKIWLLKTRPSGDRDLERNEVNLPCEQQAGESESRCDTTLPGCFDLRPLVSRQSTHPEVGP